MHAMVGQRILIHGKSVGQADHRGEIREIRGENGSPPYFVRFDDGHEALVYPGPDCVIEHQVDA